MKKISPLFSVFILFVFTSCSIQKQIAKQAKETILTNPDFAPANIGISLYDPSTKKYLYNFQGDKFFVPASNTKLFTCYAAMKTLGDSLVGLRYSEIAGNQGVMIEPAADPTFLLPEFKNQPVLDFLKKQKAITYLDDPSRNQFNGFGRGWAWDDYASDYSPERSEFPVHGNYITFTATKDAIHAAPALFEKKEYWPLSQNFPDTRFRIERKQEENLFYVKTAGQNFSSTIIPFKIGVNKNDAQARPVFLNLIEESAGKELSIAKPTDGRIRLPKIIHSQPTDSMLKIMMHRSDNFFAEQTLLMVSNERLGFMSDRKVIDTLLKTDFAGLPQQPQWVDGSGLSRYNLISPQDFVWVLTQMKNEFKWERIKEILPTGGEGTLSSYYKNYSGRIYAKTGSLSNHLALSGYITTNKGKQLVFSVLVNAHNTAAANIRKAVEKFLVGVMEKY